MPDRRNPHGHGSGGEFDMRAAARRVLASEGFAPELDPPAQEQLETIQGPARLEGGVRDLRHLPWSSIDNEESRDLDQVEVTEALPDGSIKLIVGIADVDALVPKDSPLDRHAFANCTSVYTGIAVFPMLPEKLSTDFTSLNEGEDRIAMAIETIVSPVGDVVSFDLYRVMVHNRAKLSYETVGAFLANGSVPRKIANDPILIEQLELQHDASQRLKAQRIRDGAVELDTIEATPIAKDGRIVDLRVIHKNQARDLIEDFMIASNVATAKFLEAHGRSGIRRVVREPKRWAKIAEVAAEYGTMLPAEPDSVALARFLGERRRADPERFPDLSLTIVKLMGRGIYALDLPGKDPGGHFGLAAHDYSHSTAPNRRYADLVTQRLVKAALADSAPPYPDTELSDVAARCTEREDAENKVERTIRKTAAALLLSDHVGESFDAIVTGASKKGVFARTIRPPAEGMVVRGHAGFDVGDKVRVRLVSADPERGHVDFEGLGER